jgi:nucleoside-diphosphate-sugar epimerase
MPGKPVLARIISEDADRICARLDQSAVAGKRVLITGSSGLIGIYFLASLRRLINRGAGCKVTLVVFSAPDALFSELAAHPDIEVVRGDIADPLFCRTLPISDLIIHSAGYGQPGRFMSDPVKTIALNAIGTVELINRLTPDGKFLFTSSAEVYTGLVDGPFHESRIGTTNTDHPRACYIEGKRVGEAICHAWRQRGVAAKSARIALTYGPGTKPHDRRVLNMFIEKGLSGTIDMVDGGEALRTFIYVTDTVEALWNILLSGRDGVYNVGGQEEVSIFDLAETTGRLMNASVTRGATDGVAGAPAVVRLDMSRYEAEFGKQELVPLQAGLARTIEWQRALYAQDN